MTIKEIMQLTGKAKNTVCLWCSKIEQVSSKIEQAKNKNKAADFTLDETIEILRAGKISESLISLLTENAKIKQSNNLTVEAPKNLEVITRSELKDFAKEIIQEVIKSMIPLMQQQPKQIDIRQDYYSILGYCKLKQIDISFSEAKNIGKQAVKLSNDYKFEIRKIPDERFGFVNSYSIEVLKELFTL